MLVLLLFLLGICIGSFLNVVIDRSAQGESIFFGRSHCDYCKHTLAWYDLIPVLSFIFLLGRCRYCGKKLSWQYPLIELLTGMLFVAVFQFSVFIRQPADQFSILYSVKLFLLFSIIASLIALFMTDLKYEILPDGITLFGASAALLYAVFFSGTIVNQLLAGLGTSLFFLLLYLATRRRGMGFGDVKLAILLGWFVGFPNIFLAVYLAFLTGGLTGIILILAKKKKLKGDKIPFGPFLIGGTVLTFFCGQQLWQLTMRFLGI